MEENEYCEGCGVIITGDDDAENGYCFNCIMNSCIPGNYSN